MEYQYIILFRVIGWSTEWLVSKYTPVEFRIGSVGFLTVGRVQVRFKNIVLVSIKHKITEIIIRHLKLFYL